MAHSKTPVAIVAFVWREQGGVCPWCMESFPLARAIPHHWLFKRQPIPETVLHHPFNIIAIDQLCHNEHGQSKDMTARCLEHKVNELQCDIYEWIEAILRHNQISHWPIGLPRREQ